LREAAGEIAAESSIGTWTELKTLKKSTVKKLGARVFHIDPIKKIIKIAYPLDDFELGSIPQLLSAVAGNIFSIKMVTHLRLEDIDFPKKYIDKFQGPAFGIEGIRKHLKIYNRPLIGSIIKPKVGLSAKEHAQLAYTIWKNGVDVVKDDENLTDMTFNHFTARVTEVLKMQKKVEKETGQKKMAILNVTARPDIMLQRAKFIKKMGGKCAMIDIVSTGLDNVHWLRDQNLGLILHGHRAGHSMFTRMKHHGMSMLVEAKLARLAGIDQLHTGTVVGKMEGSAREVIDINKTIESITGKWHHIKPVMPIASGGLYPSLIPSLVKILGQDLIINFGGGLHGHPKGSAAGARACVQATEAAMKGVTLREYAKDHKELKEALQYWQIKEWK